MKHYWTQSTAIKALVLTSALVVSMAHVAFAQTTAPLSEQGQRVMAKPLTAAQRAAQVSTGAAAGNQALSNAESSTVQGSETGGAKNAGCTTIGGKCVDNEEIMGRGYDQTKVDRAGTVDGKMSSLKGYHDEEAEKIKADDGAVGAAYRVSEESADRKVIGRRDVAETNWQPARQALEDGKNGTAGGMTHPVCETTTTVIPGTSEEAHIKEQHVCEIVNSPGTQGETLCTRERVPTGSQEEEHQFVEEYLGTPGGVNEDFCQKTTSLEPYAVVTDYTKTGELEITTETGGLSCTRNRWVDLVANGYAKEKTATLGINTEAGGLSCSRAIIPSPSSTTTPQTMAATLPVDNQSGGNLCKRLVWPINTTTPTSGSQTSVLNVNQEAGGLSCTRTVWPTSSSTTSGQSQDATLLIDTQSNASFCTREVWPTSGTGTSGGSKAATLSINGEVGGLICTRIIDPVNNTQTTAGNKNVVASVNNEIGGLSCQRWRNVAQNFGSPVTTSNFTYTDPTRLNYGTGPWTVVTDLSGWVPGGTESLQNFTMNIVSQDGYTHTFYVSDPPTAANGWRATVITDGMCEQEPDPGCGAMLNTDSGEAARTASVSKTLKAWALDASGIGTAHAAICKLWICDVATVNTANFTFTPKLSTKSWTVSESGNCGDTGTAYCPAVWSCNTAAPTTISGIAVSAAEVQALGALYPGEGVACTSATLARTCGGSAGTSNNFYIGDQLPPGTTSISGFQATIQNPQSGVSRVITQVPSAANGWVAIIRIDRTDFSYTPANVQLALSWNQTATNTTAQVIDSGNCNVEGTASCPALWECTRHAQYTTPNGTVTTALANAFAPLFPGAPSTCGQATKTRYCGGTANTSNSISIAADLAPGTTSITGFTFSVSNPQAGVTVTLVQTPSAANSWVAIFDVARSNWATVAAPQIVMTWNNVFGTTNTSTRDIGSCSGSSSPNCPATWACTANAPQVINGITVTGTMAAQVAPLFPGASSACVRGTFSRSCSGTASTNTTVDLSARMPAGTASISGLTFAVLNPQSGVTVTMTGTPTSGNGWVATFRVDRTYWAGQPAQPNIRITWNATVPTTNLTTVDSGNCNDPGSQTCPTYWTCSNTAPWTVNGISVTAAMAANQAPLFAGAPNSCVVASLSRTCTGSSTVGNTISIAARIPAGVNAISNFGFTVNNPQAGVTVALVSAPTQANGWVATFNVTRAGSPSVPAQPQINMSWDMSVPGVNVTVQDTGNCAASGTAQCPAIWSCQTQAPTVANGINVTTAMAGQVAPLFPGAASTCAVGSLDKQCGGSANTQTSISIAAKLPPGTTAISNFTFVVSNPQAGVTVTNTQVPSQANGWIAIFAVTRTDFATPKADPNINLSWDASVPTVELTVTDSGSCTDPGSVSCPTQWACVSSAPVAVNGITITAAMAATKSPLFPGASSACVRGDLSRVCQGSAVVGTTVGIGELIPGGAIGISNFAFTVLNPQTGVTVTLADPPTLANGWTATFNVTRTDWSQTPVAPQIKITFTVNQMDPVFSVKETGDCADVGSQACPTTWSCAANAPTTINNVNVTADQVTPLPVLYPGAAATCVTGELKRVCGGSSSAQTTISIADKIAAGTTEITEFAWNYTNPDPALTVTLVSAPTEANGWGATFAVTRNYAGGGTPAKPSITLSWKVTTTAYNARIITTGDCTTRTASLAPSGVNAMLAAVTRKVAGLTLKDALAAIRICQNPEDPGCDGGGGGGGYPPGENPPPEPPPTTPPGDACQVKWVCTKAMPAEIGGIPVSQAMLDERGPLFDGDGPPAQCLEATYKRECQNAGAGGVTEISIADKLRPGTETITGYTWSLVEPGAGVTVASTQDPAKSNNWVAKFTVTRTDFNVAPVSPKVRLEWNQPGEITYEFPIKETGDCNAGVEDEFCKITWTCEDKAPQPTRPLKVCNHIQTPWYSAATSTFGNPGEKNFNLQSFIANGTRAVEAFRYVVNTNVTGCQVNVSPFPPAVGSMTVNQTTSSTGANINCAPQIRFEWDNLCDDDTWTPPPTPPGGWGPPGRDPYPAPYQQLASLNPTQQFIVATRLVKSELLRSAMAAIMICEGVDCEIGGPGGWDGGDVTDEPPLFPGDGPPASCMKATKKLDCTGTWTGTECWTDADGNEHCETVDPDTQPNNECPQYEADPNCQLIKSECTDGAMATNGTCYVQSRLYECKREIPGGVSDPVIQETTTCTTGGAPGTTLPIDCMDGSCTKTETEESPSMSKAGAKMMLLQTVMHDTSTPPGVVAANDVGGTSDVASVAPKRSMAESLLDIAGVGTANAQSIPNPFQPPAGEEGGDEGDPDGFGGQASASLAGANIRFFPGKMRDCMKALGGLFNCCKKRPNPDQAPTLWEYMKKNMAQANNAFGKLQEAGQGDGAFSKLIAGAGHGNLQEQFTSNLTSLMGGGSGGGTNTDNTMGKAYNMFMEHEKTVVKPKLGWYCDNDEFELAVGQQTGTCTYLGSFCQTKVLGMCVIKKDRFCCFNSPVTRIIREDMSKKGIASLGTAKNHQCQGITVQQMSQLNLDQVGTDEVEGRMAQGKFNIDIAALQNMSFTELSSMMDGANSLLGDETRVNPEQRNQGYVDTTDPNGAYASIMGDQAAYRPTTPTPTVASEGTVGLNAVERDVARGFPLSLNVIRTGTKGAVSVRVFTEDGTAIAGTHYQAISTVVTFADGEKGTKKVLLKPLVLTAAQLPVPRQWLKVKIQIVAGTAKLDGNPETLIWLSAEK